MQLSKMKLKPSDKRAMEDVFDPRIHEGIIQNYEDMIQIYPIAQYYRYDGHILKTISESKSKENYFYTASPDGKIYLQHNFSGFPAKVEEVREQWGDKAADEWFEITGGGIKTNNIISLNKKKTMSNEPTANSQRLIQANKQAIIQIENYIKNNSELESPALEQPRFMKNKETGKKLNVLVESLYIAFRDSSLKINKKTMATGGNITPKQINKSTNNQFFGQTEDIRY